MCDPTDETRAAEERYEEWIRLKDPDDERSPEGGHYGHAGYLAGYAQGLRDSRRG